MYYRTRVVFNRRLAYIIVSDIWDIRGYMWIHAKKVKKYLDICGYMLRVYGYMRIYARYLRIYADICHISYLRYMRIYANLTILDICIFAYIHIYPQKTDICGYLEIYANLHISAYICIYPRVILCFCIYPHISKKNLHISAYIRMYPHTFTCMYFNRINYFIS